MYITSNEITTMFGQAIGKSLVGLCQRNAFTPHSKRTETPYIDSRGIHKTNSQVVKAWDIDEILEVMEGIDVHSKSLWQQNYELIKEELENARF